VGVGTRMLVRLGEAIRTALPRREPAAPAVEWLTAGEGPPGRVASSYPLSPMQQAMLLESLTARRPGLNLQQIVCRFAEEVDVPALRRAWVRTVRQHAVLRSRVRSDGAGKYVQDVHDAVRVRWEAHDWGHLSAARRRDELSRFLREDRQRDFDFSATPLMRLALIRDGRRRYQCWWTVHHLVADARTFLLVLSDVLACYDAYRQGREPELREPRRYAEHVEWLQRLDHARAEPFWRRRLEGFRAPTPLTVARGTEGTGGGEEVRGEQEFALSRSATSALRTLGSANGFTLNTVVLGAWALLLSRYSGQDDVLFGAVRAVRRAGGESAEDLVGVCINTVPVRVRIPEDGSLLPWLRGLREEWRTLREHEQCPLPLVRGWSEVAPGRPLFETLVNFQEPGWNATLREQPGNRSRDFGIVSMPGQALALDGYGGPSLVVKLLYDPARLEAAAVERMLRHLRTLLERMASGGDPPLAALELLTPAERRRVVVGWNDTATRFPRDRSVHALYEEQARRTPSARAVTFGADHLTYAKLDRRAERLAALLRERGVGRNSIVGVCLHRSVDLVVALLGVLKAGGAYLPLDPGYPQQRLALMLADSRVSVIVTQERLRAVLPDSPAEVISLDGDWARGPRGSAPAPAPPTGSAADDPAYVMYTSGSTGTPKGVVVPHRAVVRLVRNTSYIRLGPRDRVAQASNAAFDAATFEIWGALLNGAELVGITTDVLLSPGQYASQLQRDRITALFMTTALFNAMAREVPAVFRGVRTVLFGGEKVDPHWVRQILASGPPERLVHVYGPTETTTFATAFVVRSVPPHARMVPIGRPIANTQVYVVDRVGHPVPVGVPGELLIGGDGVALGYLNRPELDAQKFPADRFRGGNGSRLYRTGDLVRYGPEGDLEFLGRVDNQVKIRGFRVEPEEIESVLAQHPAVRGAVIVLREDVSGDRRLVAYVVLDGAGEGGLGQLRRFLSAKLPDYMIPSAFVVLPSLPLTANGKIDREALPRPADVSSARPGSDDTTARTPVEEIVAAVWADVLATPSVESDANFFEKGGDSLLAMEVMIQLGEAFQLDLSTSLLFERPTVAGLSGAIDELRSQGKGRWGPLTAVSRDRPLPLSYAQERVWRYCQNAADPQRFVSATALRLKGPLDVAAFERALTEMVRRHEVLRTTFSVAGGQPVQIVGPARPVSVPVVPLPPGPGAWDEARRLAEAETKRPFDLERDPMIRLTFLRKSDTDHMVLLSAHHLVYAPSVRRIFFREMNRLYGAYSRGAPSPLPEPAFQYGDFAVWQRRWLHEDSELYQQQLAYWKGRLRGPLPVFRPAPRPAPAGAAGRESSSVRARIPDKVYRGLMALGRREGATLHMVLLAACKIVLAHAAGLEDVVVGSVVEGSNPRGLGGVVGLKGNLVVLRTDLSGDPTFRELLRRVRRVTLEALDHQDLPFEELMKALTRDGGVATPIQVIIQHTRLEGIEWGLPGLVTGRWRMTRLPKAWGLTVGLTERFGRALVVKATFDTELYDWATMAAMVRDYLTLLARVAADPDLRFSALRSLGP
jgi:amino acid adenylation domain-containing protein